MIKVFEFDKAVFDEATKDLSAKDYLQEWKAVDTFNFNLGREYVENIKLGMQAASLVAIEKVIS